ncbi:hypothetical protein FB45DRAFT_989770 [Roridomyces roridus]|uniref:Alpha-ketoglutarate-dependent dioxygenase AlkB-like domain-containing protein n=1 Tax=Roridomyces roridus TaxID=1738132 RepID=A0AAD7BX10_9AGAR|nr:hypothetical protein FB45DRAFT_989770 [Roridomyces roridus]
MILRRSLSTLNASAAIFRRALPPQDFEFIPDFLSLTDQRILLSAALQKLDSMESSGYRRRRKAWVSARHTTHPTTSNPLRDIFFPDECYNFEEGHFDGVIRNYREIHLTSWPDIPGLPSVLERLGSLLPSRDVQTHLLHLASNGEIFPHVDNLEASGTWILGVSLGSQRLLRLEGPENESFEVLLPSGSVYIQRDSLRFNYKHSIPLKDNGRDGQRVSVMIRTFSGSALRLNH